MKGLDAYFFVTHIFISSKNLTGVLAILLIFHDSTRTVAARINLKKQSSNFEKNTLYFISIVTNRD